MFNESKTTSKSSLLFSIRPLLQPAMIPVFTTGLNPIINQILALQPGRKVYSLPVTLIADSSVMIRQ